MVVLPLSKLPKDIDADSTAPRRAPKAQSDDAINWARVTAAATLVTSGALLLAGKRRLGLVAAATGTSLAMIDQQDTLKQWWALLPGYIAEVQKVLNQVEETVDEVASQRDKLGQFLHRPNS
jgi:hypothetical protein